MVHEHKQDWHFQQHPTLDTASDSMWNRTIDYMLLHRISRRVHTNRLEWDGTMLTSNNYSNMLHQLEQYYSQLNAANMLDRWESSMLTAYLVRIRLMIRIKVSTSIYSTGIYRCKGCRWIRFIGHYKTMLRVCFDYAFIFKCQLFVDIRHLSHHDVESMHDVHDHWHARERETWKFH
jgi:hypothetical protein